MQRRRGKRRIMVCINAMLSYYSNHNEQFNCAANVLHTKRPVKTAWEV